MVTTNNVLDNFNRSLNEFREMRAGKYKGTAFDDSDNFSYWVNVRRQHARKYGNKYKKLTGVYPPGYSEVI